MKAKKYNVIYKLGGQQRIFNLSIQYTVLYKMLTHAEKILYFVKKKI